MSKSLEEYIPLAAEDPSQTQDESDYTHRRNPSMRSRYGDKLPYLLVILLQSICLLVVSIAFVRKSGDSPPNMTPVGTSTPNQIWSPAQDIIEHEVKVFTGGFDNQTTIYQETSDAADKAWEDLYNRTLMKINKNEASQLPNKTYPIKDSPGYYITELDVFHQLHCLNKIRQALNKDRYWGRLKNAEEHLGDDHISHCVDSIRQSLMCNADISTIPWQWHEPSKSVKIRLNYPHKCVNFEKLWDWVYERHLDEYIDPNAYVADELPEPKIVY